MRKDIFDKIREELGDYFRTDKKIDETKFDTEDYVGDLLECYEKRREEETVKGVLDSYQIATELLKKYKIPSLSEDEINEFVDEWDKRYLYSGIFISTVINELYKSEELQLDSFYLGCYNENKKIIIEGDCGYGTGAYMKGGEIVVKGDCKDWTGRSMKGGKIIIKGDCKGVGMGSKMRGGEIRIYYDNFNPRRQISGIAEKGEIYHKDELVWKNGEFTGDSI